jgi:hypothetical protein
MSASIVSPRVSSGVLLGQLAAGTSDPLVVGRRLRTTFLVLSSAWVLAVYALLRRHIGAPWALAGAAVCALHVWTIFVTDIAFGELPFALLTVLFFLANRQGASFGRDAAAGVLPPAVRLRTGLKGVMPPFVSDPARALELLEAVPVQYLIVDGRTASFTRVFGLPAVERAPERGRDLSA